MPSQKYFLWMYTFVVKKLTGRVLVVGGWFLFVFNFSIIIKNIDLHVYSRLHRHMSDCNAAEHLKAMIPPSLVLDLHSTDTSSKKIYPSQLWQATWWIFYQNIHCTWYAISQLTAGSGKSDITWCISRRTPNWQGAQCRSTLLCSVGAISVTRSQELGLMPNSPYH